MTREAIRTAAQIAPGVREDLGPLAEGQVGGDDQRAAFVALREDLEDEPGGAVRKPRDRVIVKANRGAAKRLDVPESSLANADDRLPVGPLSRVEGGDGVVQGR